MELKGRLKLIADKIPQCDVLCDIGTDHAYIPIYAVLNNLCKKGIAADVKEGPVAAAQANVRAMSLQDRIDVRLGDGLEPIRNEEADAIVIAGMGGKLLVRILKDEIKKAKEASALILQPMNSIEVLREWLYKNGFEIYDEELVMDEKRKIYNVLSARWTGNTQEFHPRYLHIGKRLIEKKDPLLTTYLNRRIKQLDRALLEMKNSKGAENEMEKQYLWMRNEFAELIDNLHCEKERDGM